jgi:hypothetical protein
MNPAGQPVSSAALAGQLVSSSAFDCQPVSLAAPARQPVSLAAPDGQPVSLVVPSIQPISLAAPAGQPVSLAVPAGQLVSLAAQAGQPVSDDICAKAKERKMRGLRRGRRKFTRTIHGLSQANQKISNFDYGSYQEENNMPTQNAQQVLAAIAPAKGRSPIAKIKRDRIVLKASLQASVKKRKHQIFSLPTICVMKRHVGARSPNSRPRVNGIMRRLFPSKNATINC